MPAATPPAPIITNVVGTGFTVTGPTPFDSSWLDGEGNSILGLQPDNIAGGEVLLSPIDGSTVAGYLNTVSQYRWQMVTFRWRVLGSSPVVQSDPVNVVFIKDTGLKRGGTSLSGPMGSANLINEWRVQKENEEQVYEDFATPGLDDPVFDLSVIEGPANVRIKAFYDNGNGDTGTSASPPFAYGQNATFVAAQTNYVELPAVQDIEDATTIVVNVEADHRRRYFPTTFRVEGMAGDRTFDFTGEPLDGQKLLIQIKADSTPRTPIWPTSGDNEVSFSQAGDPGEIPADTWRYYAFWYNGSAGYWSCVGYV